ncbi:GGDEF domain-containing protein [Photobacterium swingsii]|uniref:GGDEF domain-containing protein n=1 Tax=Photobacterium swingsii TaxID=680026 RepID=UPI00352F3943
MTLNKLRFEHGDDELLDFYRRQHILKFITAVTIFTFIPLGIKNLLIGETLLGLSLLAFELSFIIEMIGLLYVERKIIGNGIPLSLLVISITLSIYELGMFVSYWVYPIAVTLVFIIPRRQALITNTCLVVGCGITSFYHVDWQYAVRFISSLIACAGIAHVAVEAIHHLQVELRYLSTRDALTGTLNRHQLDAFMNRSIAQKNRGFSACVALIDIDHFKQVNDLYGHDVGDTVIKNVVETLNQHTRDLDILFRLGGDEFLILFDNTNMNEAFKVMDTLSQHIREQHYPYHAKVTISVGLSPAFAEDDAVRWIKRADIALYQSKENGRDQITINAKSDTVTNININLNQRVM